MSSPTQDPTADNLCDVKYTEICGALDEEACDYCQDHLATPRDSDICDDCRDAITQDTSSISDTRLLKLQVHSIYAFYASFRKQTLFNRWTASDPLGVEPPPVREITIVRGIPGRKKKLPRLEELGPKAQRLYDLVVLSAMDCQYAVMLLDEVLRVALVGK